MLTHIFAHRGASAAAPENTMAAFELAKRVGADGIELDVHLTSDGEIVVIHDDRVDRTSNGTGAVHETPFARLRELDISMGRPGFEGARIPTLEEVYDFIRPTNLVVNVEIKEDAYDHGFLILPPLLRLTQRYNLADRVVYSSFNHYVLRELKQQLPSAETAILYSAALVDVWQYTAMVPADGIHPRFAALEDPEVTPRCHAAGQAVRPWTVNEESDLKEMFRQRVDAVITNVPDRALKLRRDIQAQ